MIEKIFVVSFIVMGIWATMWDGGIFDFVRKFGEKHLPEKLQKPIYDCPICMNFWYGTAAYWLIWGAWLHTAAWQEWLVVVIAGMGVNATLIKLFPEE